MNPFKRALHTIGTAAFLVLSGLCLLGAAYQQNTGGTIEGTTVDSQGAVIPGATVTLLCDCKECPDMPCAKCCPENFSRMANTDDDGRFSIADVPAGVYVINGTASGFGTTTIRGVRVEVNAAQTVTLTFSPGGDSPTQTKEKKRQPHGPSNAATTQEATTPRPRPSPTPRSDDTSMTTVQSEVVDKNNGRAVAGATVVFRLTCDCNTECPGQGCPETCCPIVATKTSDQDGRFTVRVPAGEYKTRTQAGAYTVDKQITVKSKPNQKVKFKVAIAPL